MPTTRVAAAVALLAAALLAGTVRAQKPPPVLQLPAGTRIGIVTLLDAEVTHYHAAAQLEHSFLKTHPVDWPVSAMLADALQGKLRQLGFVPVSLEASAALRTAREACFLNAALGKGLPKECRAPFAQFLSASQVGALIVLGPGLNNSAHAGSGRRKDLPDYLRGWCLVSGEGAQAHAPVLLNLSELLLLRPGVNGAELMARQWGGDEVQSWTGFVAPPDLKALGSAQLAPARSLYAALLGRQADALLAPLHAAP